MATREPGGIAISEDIRTILHKQEYTMMEARTEALYMLLHVDSI